MWSREDVKLYAEGDATQEEIAGRYGRTQPQIAGAISTSEDKRLYFKNINDLPRNKQVLYLLTTLPDKDFEELCKPQPSDFIYKIIANALKTRYYASSPITLCNEKGGLQGFAGV